MAKRETYIEGWHRVVVTDIEDPDGELEFEVEHLEECGLVIDENGGWWDNFACGIGSEIMANGYDNFEITEPGIYRARFICIEGFSMDSIGPEYDIEIEVERVE